MKKVITIIITIVIALTAVSALAEPEQAYPGNVPYDETGNCPEEALGFCADGGQAIFQWLGIRMVAYFTEDCGGLTLEQYAQIISRVRASVVGDVGLDMLIVADADTKELYVMKGSECDSYLTDDELNDCIETAFSSEHDTAFEYVEELYKAVALSLVAKEDEIEAARASEAAEGTDDPFYAELSAQPVYISSTSLIVQSDEYKSLYPDLLQATIVNNSEDDVKDVTVAFMAWDNNNLPVLLKTQFDFSAAAYVKQGNYTGVNLVPGGTYGENAGLKLDESVKNVATVKAIVVSYETFDGETWINPLYEQYVEQYEGKKLLQ